MQTIIDLDLRQAIGDFGFKSPAIPYAGKSQDTQSHEIYFVQGGVVQDLGTSPAIKFGLIGPGGPSLLVLQTSYTRQVDAGGNVFYLGFPIFNTSNLANALGSNTSIACISEVRYQLSTGEIEHTLDIPITIFRTILSEITSDTTTAAFTAPAVGANVTIAIGNTTWLQVNQQLTIATAGIYQVVSITDATHFVAQNTGQPGNAISGTVIASGSAVAGAPVNALTTYPPSNTLELISTRDVASGHAGLTAAKLLNPTVIPVDNVTIQILDGQIASSFILAETAASFVTPAANATVNVTLVSSTGLIVGQYVRLPVAGYYIVQSIPDSTHAVLQNNGDPVNAASGVTIAIDTPLLPAQAAAGGGSAGQNAYTTTTASFTVPAAGSTVSVAVVSTAWMGGSGYYVFITGAGYYAVNSITDSTHVVLTNTGSASNAIAGTTVASGVTVTAAGPAGTAGTPGTSGAALSAYDALASPFTMPAVSGTVTITIGNTAWISANQIIYIATAGYLQVSAISSATQVLVTNLNYPGNATAGTVIASGSRVSPGGLQGPPGAGGAGLNAFTTLSANFIQPAINATVTVNVGSTTWMATGQGIFIQGGGYYTISSIADATHAVVTNFGGSANPAAGSTITGSGTQNVTPAGTPGVAGSSSYTTTTASFVMPGVASSVTVTLASTSWMAQAQNVYVVGAGYFDISSITDATHAVLINLGSLGNVSSGTTIPSGSMVSTAGATGPTGSGGGGGTSLSDAETTSGVSIINAPSGVLKRLVAGSGVTLTDNTTNISIAATSAGAAGFDPRSGFYCYDDFIYPNWTSQSTQPPEYQANVGSNGGGITAAAVYGQDGTRRAQGVVELATLTGTSGSGNGGSFNRGQMAATSAGAMMLGFGICDIAFRVALEEASLPATGAAYFARVGLMLQGSLGFPGSQSNTYYAVFLEYSPDNNSGNFRIGTFNNSGGAAMAPTYVNCTVGPAANTFGWWELKIDASGNITAYLNGSSCGTASAAAPTAVPMCPFASVQRNLNVATNYHMAVDVLFINYPYTR
jgi:hypothetical protein